MSNFRNTLSVGLLLTAFVALAPMYARADGLSEHRVSGRGENEVAALDAAFVQAVSRAIQELVSSSVAPDSTAVNDLLARSRPYVSSYTVNRRSTEGGFHVVVATVRVDRDKLREALRVRGVGVATNPQVASVATVAVAVRATATGSPFPEPRIELSLATPRADPGGESGRALIRALESRGYRVTPANGSRPNSATAETSEGFALDDRDAALLAAEIQAQGTVVLDVRAAEEGAIRGTHLRGFVAQARIRVVKRNDDLVASGSAEAAGYGAGSAGADSALARATLRVVASVGSTMDKAWTPTRVLPSQARGGVSVTIVGAPSLATVLAVLRQLSGTRSVSAVHLEGFQQGSATLKVVSALRPEEIVSSIRRSALPKGVAIDPTLIGEGIRVAVLRQPIGLQTPNATAWP